MGSGALSMLMVVAYSFACTCVGVLALRALGAAFGTLFERLSAGIATAFLVGQALIGAILVALGLASALNAVTVSAVLFLVTLAGLPATWTVLARIPQAARGELAAWPREEPGLKLIAAAAIVLALGHGAAAWLRPPVGDAEAFYVAYAKIIAAREALIVMPGSYSPFSSIGLSGELHFAALMLLADVRAAKLFVWPVGIAAAALLAGIGSRAGLGRAGNLLVMVMLLSTTTFTYYLSDGKVDLFAAALGLAAVYAAMTPLLLRENHGLVPVIGFTAGAAAVAKFSYIAGFLPALVALVAWRTLADCDPLQRGTELRRLFAAFVAMAGWAVLAWMPHFAKNASLFGAPLAPFFGDAQWLSQTWFAADTTRWIVLTYPFALVFGQYPMQGGGLSFLLLAFVPLTLLLPRLRVRWRKPLVQLTGVALVGTLLWIALCPSIIAPRYLLATLLLFFPLAARAAEHVWLNESPPRVLRFGLVACVCAALFVAAYPLLSMARLTWKHAAERTPECALASDHCAPMLEVNRLAPPGDRVLLASYYGYWLRSDLLQCRDDASDVRALRAARETGRSLETAFDRGFGFIVVDPATHADELKWIEGASRPSWLSVIALPETPGVRVFRLASSDSSRTPTLGCRPMRPAGWSIEKAP